MKYSAIEWTDATWNPVRGCSRVSTGCENCYAEGVARRFSGPGQPYEGLVRLDASGKAKAQWNGTVRLVPEHLGDPLRWAKPRLVFVNSMSDLFHESLSLGDIAAVFGVMASAQRHTFQVLTKRPERARAFFAWIDAEADRVGTDHHAVCVAHAMRTTPWRPSGAHDFEWPAPLGGGPWPLPNVWLGVSVEDQSTADERIPVLLTIPASVRWVSYEPALGPINWKRVGSANDDSMLDGRQDVLRFGAPPLPSGWIRGLDWVVVGGESGPKARPFDIAWACSTVAACRAAGVPCFVKQLGARPVVQHPVGQPGELVEARLADRKGGDPSEWPEDLRVREWPERWVAS
jgi:protein gp37